MTVNPYMLCVVVVALAGGCAGRRSVREYADANAVVTMDVLPDSFMRRENWAYSPEHLTSPFLRGILFVQFAPSASAADRRRAVESVRGRVFGKQPLGSDFFYFVSLPAGEPDSGVFVAIRALKRQPAVRRALPQMVMIMPPHR